MKTDFSRGWHEEFKSFMDEQEVTPPEFLSKTILNQVRRDLNPNWQRVLSKLMLIHAPMGSLSLLLCSQFGVGRGNALTHTFMSFGVNVCMFLCGALFLGATSIAASIFMTQAELLAIRKLMYLPLFALGAFSLIAFYCMGASIAIPPGILWLVGGIVAGILITEAGIRIPRLRAMTTS